MQICDVFAYFLQVGQLVWNSTSCCQLEFTCSLRFILIKRLVHRLAPEVLMKYGYL